MSQISTEVLNTSTLTWSDFFLLIHWSIMIRRSKRKYKMDTCRWSLVFTHCNCKSLGELEKSVKTLASRSCSRSISRSSKFPLVFLQLDKKDGTCFLGIPKLLKAIENRCTLASFAFSNRSSQFVIKFHNILVRNQSEQTCCFINQSGSNSDLASVRIPALFTD